uniref:Serpentine receptor class gamma n=1 Tax=Caenorhabditis tropicalis TaxID=1561998 RepID=A0A1I7UWG8_9PELO
MPSTLSTVTFIFGWFSFFISISSTISLIVLIETKSRKDLGGYKNFLRIYSLYAFCFAMIDWLVQPAILQDINGYGYAFYSENRMFDLGYTLAHFIQSTVFSMGRTFIVIFQFYTVDVSSPVHLFFLLTSSIAMFRVVSE